jgi:hypothetical protein
MGWMGVCVWATILSGAMPALTKVRLWLLKLKLLMTVV